MTTVKNIYDYINQFAPFQTQEAWDNAGFLVGDFRKAVARCMVVLDITNEAVCFAETQHVDLIISHHPVIFQKLSALPKEHVVYQLAQSGVAALCAHTNYDIADEGVNEVLANVLGLEEVHSDASGALRIGALPQPMQPDRLAAYLKNRLCAPALHYTAPEKTIQTLAVCGGAGADFAEAAFAQADAFLTGDASYHTLLDAQQAGNCLLAAGHFETELPAVHALRNRLKTLFTDVQFLEYNEINLIQTL